jgi:anaerobic ribonucleoside-triphosphate reductase
MAVNFLYTLQGESAGAQAFSNFDTYLAPFIRYDGLGDREVKQAIQEAVFNFNVPTRVGFQTPFTNVTCDLVVPSHLAHSPVIIGGVPQNETYDQFQPEMNVFNTAFLEVMSEGDANGRVHSFPIPTYSITKDFDWDHPSLDSLWEATAKYGIPYFANFVNSDMSTDDVRSMCCRLRIDNRQLRQRGGGLFGANPLTGSIGVVTLNMPRLARRAAEADDPLSRFNSELFRLMDLARDSLATKRKILERLTDKGLYPYTKHYLRGVKRARGSYWANHFSTIGIVGMNEASVMMTGEPLAGASGKAFVSGVLDAMRDKMTGFQVETGVLFNLEATPAEATSYRLALSDKERFDDMVFGNGTGKDVEHPFYTNSVHLPVGHTQDPFEILDNQDDLQTKFTGGTVIHFFLGEKPDPKAVKSFVRTVCTNYRLPYSGSG